MLDAVAYSALETLRNGRRIEIRAFRPDDREALEKAVSRTSPLSLYRRFFTIKRDFMERQRKFFLSVDFVNHVALVALMEEAGEPAIVGGGRYVVVKPGKAELAFVVIDEYQGQGIGGALLRHLAILARAAGLHEFIAEVLAENSPMLKVFENCGLPVSTMHESEYVHVTLLLA
jgi:RimJ/RimL family protein N-acetyltransferase